MYYYIIRQLTIHHSDGMDIIELHRERRQINKNNNDKNNNNDNYDSDDSDIIDTIKSKYKNYLKVKYVPRIICEDNVWRSERVKDRYINLVYKKLKKYNNAFDNIYVITKKEVRYFQNPLYDTDNNL